MQLDSQMGLAPPSSESELLERAHALAGFTVGQVAQQVGICPPKTSRSGKGWVGVVVEAALGATAGSVSGPDFPGLGVELKTIPISDAGKPLESTFVCTVPLTRSNETYFEQSCVARKLARVMWFPVSASSGSGGTPPAQRRLGRALLWSPDARQLETLKRDFDEHMEHMLRGQIGRVTAKHGEILQIRPKAANSASRTSSISENGNLIETNPRGFYLRAGFTAKILSG